MLASQVCFKRKGLSKAQSIGKNQQPVMPQQRDDKAIRCCLQRKKGEKKDSTKSSMQSQVCPEPPWNKKHNNWNAFTKIEHERRAVREVLSSRLALAVTQQRPEKKTTAREKDFTNSFSQRRVRQTEDEPTRAILSCHSNGFLQRCPLMSPTNRLPRHNTTC